MGGQTRTAWPLNPQVAIHVVLKLEIKAAARLQEVDSLPQSWSGSLQPIPLVYHHVNIHVPLMQWPFNGWRIQPIQFSNKLI
jgi:hypothetical protein